MGKIYVSDLTLPEAYQQVEYLQTDGNAYILTDYYQMQYTHIEAEFGNVAGGSTDCPLFGVNNEDSKGSAWFQWAGGEYQYFSTTNGSVWKHFETTFDPAGGRFLVDKRDDVCVIYYGDQGAYSAGVEFNNSSLYTLDYYCTIFTVNTPNGVWSGIQNGARLYYCKIYDRTALWPSTEYLRRDFVPCYRKSDNEPGLYDLVNDVFYTNASSVSGSHFTCGPNVYLGVARQAKKIYAGVNGVAKQIKKIYAGVSGVAKLIYAAETPVSIPDMTSNSAPSGTASASNSYSGRNPWHAFDRDTSTFWTQSTQNSTNQWVAYDFGFPVRPTATSARTNGNNAAKTIKCQGYNTNTSSWDDLVTLSMANSTAIKSGDIASSIWYSKYRWLVTAYYSGGFARITEITLNGYKSV